MEMDTKEQQVRAHIIRALMEFQDPDRPVHVTDSGDEMTAFAYPADLPPDEMGFEAEATILALDRLRTWELAERLLRLCQLYRPEWIAKSEAEVTDWDSALGQPGDDAAQ
jgi:hypothetical protein